MTEKKGSSSKLALFSMVVLAGLPLLLLISSGIVIMFIMMFLVIGGDTEEKEESQFGAFCRTTGEVNETMFHDALANAGALAGQGDLFIELSKKHGVDPVLAVAIMFQETYYDGIPGNSPAIWNKNNPGGIMDWEQNWSVVRHFPTLLDGMEYFIMNLKRRVIDDGKTTISSLGSIYAPIGVSNDPGGLNVNWVPGVTKFANDLGGLTMNCEALQYGDFVIPTLGQFMINSQFGWRHHPIHNEQRLHAGIDLNCRLGDPIVAVADGQVVYAENRTSGFSTGWGNYVNLNHGGMNTVYAHFTSTTVQTGDVVKAGQLLGHCGSTGDSTGAHLHFEVRVGGTPMNPFPFLMGDS